MSTRRINSVQDYFTFAESLPPAPHILPRLLELLADPTGRTDRIVSLIAMDVTLTAAVLKAANSVQQGSASPVEHVNEAVARLGLDATFRVAASVAGTRSMTPSGNEHGLNPAQFWRHSVTTAFAAQCLAGELEMDERQVFTAGLLHDIGKVLLANSWQRFYRVLLTDTQAAPWEQVLREREDWTVDHCELGGRLLGMWQFSKPVVDAVRHHHSPSGGGPSGRIAACICAADAIAHSLARPVADGLIVPAVGLPDALNVLGVSQELLLSVLKRTQENLKSIDTMCNPAA